MVLSWGKNKYLKLKATLHQKYPLIPGDASYGSWVTASDNGTSWGLGCVLCIAANCENRFAKCEVIKWGGVHPEASCELCGSPACIEEHDGQTWQ